MYKAMKKTSNMYSQHLRNRKSEHLLCYSLILVSFSVHVIDNERTCVYLEIYQGLEVII